MKEALVANLSDVYNTTACDCMGSSIEESQRI